MKNRQTTSPLYHPRAPDSHSRAEAICVRESEIGPGAFEPPRTNYFTIYSIESGEGEFWADAGRYAFAPHSLLFFTPYQYIRVVPVSTARCTLIQFHANFLCVETFHAESGCAGTLFNDPFQPPIVAFRGTVRRRLESNLKEMLQEQHARPLAFEEMLLAQLKVLLIMATRLKAIAVESCADGARDARHPALAPLKQLIEENFHRLHAPSDYARLLHMTSKSLGRVVREQLGKSLTDLIRERILIHAKWQILHTLKPIKQVAHEVGFCDELYFSRMFKKATGYSPTFFREFETEIRGGSNLSMLSSPAPIQAGKRAADNSGS
jgi:AraC-like DNA-binding protein